MAAKELSDLRSTKWVGKKGRIRDPQHMNFPRVSALWHRAFMNMTRGQVVVCIAPPIWVWSDQRRLSGAWGIVVATVGENHQAGTCEEQTTKIGLLLVSTLACTDYL